MLIVGLGYLYLKQNNILLLIDFYLIFVLYLPLFMMIHYYSLGM